MKNSELRRRLELMPPGSNVPRDWILRELNGHDPSASDGGSTTDGGPGIEYSWLERLWIAPGETRLGIEEVVEALGRSRSWVYRRTGSAAEDPLPHRLLDGQLVFLAGELRHWVRTHEESVREAPMDSTSAERSLRGRLSA